MKKRCWGVLLSWTILAVVSGWAGEPGWVRTARIATVWDVDIPDFSWEAGAEQAIASGATVILDWAWVSDEWRYLYEPERSADLQRIAQRAAFVHRHPGVRYIAYFAPLEWVTDLDTDGDGRPGPDADALSVAVQHPDWAQTGIGGGKAVFDGSMPQMPFWVCPTCEDVWVTPALGSYRALVLDEARALATSGLDGIWLDVPFLNSEYGEDWFGQWPDVGDAARALFERQTGLRLPAPPIEPQWDDPVWQGYVRWRYRLIREFLTDLRDAMVEANPGFAFVVESSTGFGVEHTQTAAAPFDVSSVAHATAHEAGETRHAVQRSIWLMFLGKLAAWRHADLRLGRTSWLLSYVEDGRPETAALFRLHTAATLFSGFTTHVSGNEGMAGSPDPAFRQRLFAWMEAHRGALLPPEQRPWTRTAVLFSRDTLDFRSRASWATGDEADGFRGIRMALLETHRPFEVLAQDDLDRLDRFGTLVLPGVEAMDDGVAEAIRRWVRGGGRLVATGLTSAWDGNGVGRDDFALADLFGVHRDQVMEDDETVYENAYGAGRVVYTPAPHERWFYWSGAPWDESGGDEAAMAEEAGILAGLLDRAGSRPVLRTNAPRGVILVPFTGPSGSVRVGVVNLEGTGYRDAVPVPVAFDLTLDLPSPGGRPEASWLEFMGESVPVPLVANADGSVTVRIATTGGGLLTVSPQAPPRGPGGRTGAGGTMAVSARRAETRQGGATWRRRSE